MAEESEVPQVVVKNFDRLLNVQRPLVLAHIRGIRRRHPEASPAQIIAILERRYLAAVTTGGAAVGASAVIPGVGTAASLALSGVETAGFLEASALFAQSVAEVHGITVVEPERARSLVMALMLGATGQDLVKQFAAQFGGGGTARPAYWGEVITNSLPRTLVGQLSERLKRSFLRRFVARQGTSMLGRMVPFGVGAVIGGTGNHLLGRRVIKSAREAFPPAPLILAGELEPRPRRATDDTPKAVRRMPHLALPRRRKKGDDADAQPEAPTPALGPGTD
jgi:hypothetical protein